MDKSHVKKFVEEAEAFFEKHDQQAIDVWHSGPDSRFTMKDGKITGKGFTHERMTRREYRERYPDAED